MALNVESLIQDIRDYEGLKSLYHSDISLAQEAEEQIINLAVFTAAEQRGAVNFTGGLLAPALGPAGKEEELKTTFYRAGMEDEDADKLVNAIKTDIVEPALNAGTQKGKTHDGEWTTHPNIADSRGFGIT